MLLLQCGQRGNYHDIKKPRFQTEDLFRAYRAVQLLWSRESKICIYYNISKHNFSFFRCRLFPSTFPLSDYLCGYEHFTEEDPKPGKNILHRVYSYTPSFACPS